MCIGGEDTLCNELFTFIQMEILFGIRVGDFGWTGKSLWSAPAMGWLVDWLVDWWIGGLL